MGIVTMQAAWQRRRPSILAARGTYGLAPSCRRSVTLPKATKLQSYNVSRFTVVEAYDRLVAMGCLQSRRGAGFYTAPALAPAEATHPAASDNLRRNEE